MESKELIKFIIDRTKRGNLNWHLNVGSGYNEVRTRLQGPEWDFKLRLISYLPNNGQDRNINFIIDDVYEGQNIFNLRASLNNPGEYVRDDELRDLMVELKAVTYDNASGILSHDRYGLLLNALEIAA